MRCQFYLKKSLEFSFNVISVSHIYKKRASESILRIKEYTWKFKRRLLNIDIALRGTLSVSSHYEVSKKKLFRNKRGG